jgi:DNA topoisomerase-1
MDASTIAIQHYRSQVLWRALRDETTVHRMVAFGETVPTSRQRVAADLTRPSLSRENVLALLVRLLDAASIRIGHEEFAREQQHFGLTTLRNEHVDVSHGTRCGSNRVARAARPTPPSCMS